MVKGTSNGTLTNPDGTFTLSNVAPGATIVFSSIGYKTVEVVYEGQPVNVTIAEDNELLDESVVTALGIKRERKSLGYAVEDINASELMKNKTANAISSLSGKIAGVNITQSSGAEDPVLRSSFVVVPPVQRTATTSRSSLWTVSSMTTHHRLSETPPSTVPDQVRQQPPTV